MLSPRFTIGEADGFPLFMNMPGSPPVFIFWRASSTSRVVLGDSKFVCNFLMSDFSMFLDISFSTMKTLSSDSIVAEFLMSTF